MLKTHTRTLILVFAMAAMTLGLGGCRKTDTTGTTKQLTLPAAQSDASPLPTPGNDASPLPTPGTDASPLQP
jgi:hypothetical protein